MKKILAVCGRGAECERGRIYAARFAGRMGANPALAEASPLLWLLREEMGVTGDASGFVVGFLVEVQRQMVLAAGAADLVALAEERNEWRRAVEARASFLAGGDYS